MAGLPSAGGGLRAWSMVCSVGILVVFVFGLCNRTRLGLY